MDSNQKLFFYYFLFSVFNKINSIQTHLKQDYMQIIFHAWFCYLYYKSSNPKLCSTTILMIHFCIFCLMLLTISNFNKIFLKEKCSDTHWEDFETQWHWFILFSKTLELKKKKKPMSFLMKSVFYFIFLFFGLITDYYFLWFLNAYKSSTKLKFTRKIS